MARPFILRKRRRPLLLPLSLVLAARNCAIDSNNLHPHSSFLPDIVVVGGGGGGEVLANERRARTRRTDGRTICSVCQSFWRNSSKSQGGSSSMRRKYNARRDKSSAQNSIEAELPMMSSGGARAQSIGGRT